MTDKNVSAVNNRVERNPSFYRLLIEHSTDLIILLGERGQVLYSSPSVHAHLGYGGAPGREVPGHVRDLVHPSDWPAVELRVQQTPPDGRSDLPPYRVRHLNGHRRWLEGTVVNLLHHPDVGAYLLAVRDVTEGVRVQAELQARTQERADLLESITDAFYVLDRDWRFVYVNAQAQHLLGKSAHELIGQVKWDIFPESVNNLVGTQYREAMRSGLPQRFEVYYEPLELWAEAHLYPSARGLSVTFQDIGARKAAERADQQRSRILELTLQGTPWSSFCMRWRCWSSSSVPGRSAPCCSGRASGSSQRRRPPCRTPTAAR